MSSSAVTIFFVASVLFQCNTSLVSSFAPSSTLSYRRIQNSGYIRSSKRKTFLHASSTTTATTSSESTSTTEKQSRILGSQELLMLPRQYGVSDTKFPQMNHVSCTLLNATPSKKILLQAVQEAMNAHPLLQARVEGTGEPAKRIDLFQMVREGEPDPLRFVSDEKTKFQASDVVTFIDTPVDEASLTQSWQSAFARDLDDGSWCNVETGPLWKMEVHSIGSEKDSACALLLSFNHAISDQSSANRLTDQIVRYVAELEQNGKIQTAISKRNMPVALEDSVLGHQKRWSDVTTEGVSLNTIQYVASKAAEGSKEPVILPDNMKDNSNPLVGALSIISGREAGGKDNASSKRKSVVQFRSISKETTLALLAKCRQEGVSISNALTAAATLTASDFVGNTKDKRNYKILQSLDMRRFGAQTDRGETVACMAGSHDLMHGPLSDQSGKKLRSKPTEKRLEQFWNLARNGKQQTEEFIAKNRPEEAVRVFDFAMTISDLNNLVYLTAQSQDTKGRAYSAGVTNVGVYEGQKAFSEDDTTLQTQHGRYTVNGVYYATPHTQSGCLYPVSCLTVDGKLQLTFNPVAPIVTAETNKQFANAFVEVLETIAGTRTDLPKTIEDNESLFEKLPDNTLTLVTAAIGLVAVLSHAGAWSDFIQSVLKMKENIADPADFWAALNFWIFFAVGHPILQPILWISDVLHGSPGPKIADLIPITFLAGNLIAIGAFTFSKEFRNAVNVAAVAAFFTYVGAGLDGVAGLGDFNLALDDSYKGQIVKGCPAYEDVRQPSMKNFDLEKYQGLWYEHKFHDWTQFKEVYDTTLNIRLTEGGKGWVDDFGVKGPAPDAAPLSWEKSPVANGAHYFLFGRVDPNDPVGILREKGFGVEFPNYIVDVKTDPKTGDYVEAIQFQCLERGGVRVFEGINFMSRNPTMSEEELDAMHKRAEMAGMYPYGASPEQMHTVARRPVNAPEIDNDWQALWRAIGVDKLLELLTEAIEDGGRQ